MATRDERDPSCCSRKVEHDKPDVSFGSRTDQSPFQAGDVPRKASDIYWTTPELVANIEFAEWTVAGKVRQASYKGLREDKATADVAIES